MYLGLGSKRKRGKVVDTGYPTGLLVEKAKKAWCMAKGGRKWTCLLVEKGKKVGTGGQVNRVSPALDLLASHSIRWLYRTKMGPTQISCSDVCCPEPLLCNATGKM